MTESTPPALPPKARTPWAKIPWIGMLYFAEGTPFGVINDLVPLWLDSFGVSKTAVGLFSFLELPWSLKFLWAWLVDWFGTRRKWICGALLVEAALLALAAARGVSDLWSLGALLMAYTAAAATVDIAIDAYTIELSSTGEEGPINATRSVAYRAAWFIAGGAGVGLAGVMGWRWVMWCIAILMALLALLALILPRTELELAPRSRRGAGERIREYSAALGTWMTREGALAVLVTALFYKLPDSAMGPMPRLFWKHAGLSLEQIGWLITPLNLGATFIGSIVGGLWIARIGVLRGLLWCGLAQAISNVVYAAVAAAAPSTATILFATGFENLTGGLGTAALLSFLMRMCSKEQAALEYALLSALFALVRFPAKMISGIGAEAMGYAGFFLLTAFAALPGLAMLFSRDLASRVGELPLARRATSATTQSRGGPHDAT